MTVYAEGMSSQLSRSRREARGGGCQPGVLLTRAGGDRQTRSARVGYPSQELVSALSDGQRQAVQGRVIWASTANPFYAIDGVRPGDTLRTAEQALPKGTVLSVGQNQYYLVAAGPATAMLQVKNGGIVEIGIIQPSLTKSAEEERIVLSSFG